MFRSMFELGSDIHTHSMRQSDIIRRPLSITVDLNLIFGI